MAAVKRLEGTQLKPNARVRDKLDKELIKYVEWMLKDVTKAVDKELNRQQKELTKQQQESVAMDASIANDLVMLLSEQSLKWMKRFDKFAPSYSKKMAAAQLRESGKDVKRSLGSMAGEFSISTKPSEKTLRFAREASEWSTQLIKSMRSDYFADLQKDLSNLSDETMSFERIKKHIHSRLKERYKKYKNKAHNTGLDQIRKAYANMSDQRMRDAGATKYRWKHMGGSVEPRSYHKNVLDGQVFDLDDPPIIDPKTGERGHPSTAVNCKCIKIPVIEFN